MSDATPATPTPATIARVYSLPDLATVTPMQLVAHLSKKGQIARLTASHIDDLTSSRNLYDVYQTTNNIETCLLILEECGLTPNDVALRRYLHGVLVEYRMQAINNGAIADSDLPVITVNRLSQVVYRLSGSEADMEFQTLHAMATGVLARIEHDASVKRTVFALWTQVEVLTRPTLTYDAVRQALTMVSWLGRKTVFSSADHFRSRHRN